MPPSIIHTPSLRAEPLARRCKTIRLYKRPRAETPEQQLHPPSIATITSSTASENFVRHPAIRSEFAETPFFSCSNRHALGDESARAQQSERCHGADGLLDAFSAHYRCLPCGRKKRRQVGWRAGLG